jgi:hypothetical protein
MASEVTAGYSRHPGRTAAIALAAIGIAVVLFARAPLVFTSPRFWAEEADLFFAHALFSPGAQSLLVSPSVRAGYVNLYASIAAFAAAKLAPLELATAVTLVFSAAAQLLPLGLALFGPRTALATLPQRVALCATLMFFPYANGTAETWFNVINSQVHFGLAALVLLMDGADQRHPWYRALGRGTLLLGSLTGAYVDALLPAFLWRARATGSTEDRARVKLVLLGIAVQVAAVGLAFASGQFRDQKAPALAFGRLYSAAVFHVWYPIAGEMVGARWLHELGLPVPWSAEIANGIGAGPASALAVLAAFGLALFLAYSVRGALTGRLVALAWLGWTGLVVLFSVNGFPAFRYAVAPACALGTLALLAVTAPSVPIARRLIPAVVLLAGVGTGAFEYALTPDKATGRHGLSVPWREEVAAWRADPDRRLRVSPGPSYFVNLPDPVRLDALRRSVARFEAVRLTPAPRTIVDTSQGLPAYFDLALDVCSAEGAPAPPMRVSLRAAGGGALGAQTFALRPGCQRIDVNSMALAFAGFGAFSRVVEVTVELAPGEGAIVLLAAIRVLSPALTVDHPVSGK